MGERTPVLVMDHFKFLDASQRTTREPPVEWPGSEAEEDLLPPLLRGGNSLATHRSPCGEGVSK